MSNQAIAISCRVSIEAIAKASPFFGNFLLYPLIFAHRRQKYHPSYCFINHCVNPESNDNSSHIAVMMTEVRQTLVDIIEHLFIDLGSTNMNLYYRGHSYDYNRNQVNNQLITYPQQSHKLKYRGITYDTNAHGKVEKICLLSAAHKLIYRGIGYFTSGTTQLQVNQVTVIANH